jgi:hypothetical protein
VTQAHRNLQVSQRAADLFFMGRIRRSGKQLKGPDPAMAQHDEVGKSAAGINPDLEHSGNEDIIKRYIGKGTRGKTLRDAI